MSEAKKSQAKEITKKGANLPANFDLESYILDK